MASVQAKAGQLRRQDRDMVYDSVLIGAAASFRGDKDFFLSSQGKTLSQTNLKAGGGMFENKNSFLVQGISLSAQVYSTADGLQLAKIIENSAFIFSIGDSDYIKGPARMIAGHPHTYNPALTVLGSNRDNVYKLDGENALPIEPVQSFNLKLRVETDEELAVEASLMAILHGLKRKPAQ